MNSQEVKVTEAIDVENEAIEETAPVTAKGFVPNQVYKKNPLHLAFLIALGALACSYIANTAMYIISTFMRFTSPDASFLIKVSDVVERMAITIKNDAGEVLFSFPALGYIIFTVISAVIPTFLVIAFIYAIKLYKMDSATSIEVDKTRFGFEILRLFSVFTLIDCCFSAFTIILAAARAKNNFAFIGDALNGFYDLSIKYDFKSIKASIWMVLVVVLVFAAIIAYAVMQMMTYGKYCEYLSAASRATDSGNPVSDVKPPFITAFILAGINVGIAAIMFTSANIVTGVVYVCLAVFLVISAFYLRDLHKKIGA